MNKEDRFQIDVLIGKINQMYPYRKALVYNPKVNFIIEQLERLKVYRCKVEKEGVK